MHLNEGGSEGKAGGRMEGDREIGGKRGNVEEEEEEGGKRGQRNSPEQTSEQLPAHFPTARGSCREIRSVDT